MNVGRDVVAMGPKPDFCLDMERMAPADWLAWDTMEEEGVQVIWKCNLRHNRPSSWACQTFYDKHNSWMVFFVTIWTLNTSYKV
jgi:hypothetical protein